MSRIGKIFRPWLLSVGPRIQIGLCPSGLAHTASTLSTWFGTGWQNV